MSRRLLLVALALGACGDPRLQPPTDAALIDAAEPLIDAAPDASADARVGAAPAVIVMIGDGMGEGQLDAASLYRHGATGRLAMQQLPFHGQVRTGGPSGITDSAAAATVMATGVYTYNGRHRRRSPGPRGRDPGRARPGAELGHRRGHHHVAAARDPSRLHRARRVARAIRRRSPIRWCATATPT
jgi:hypothetical protein